jgi:hypothetical protein
MVAVSMITWNTICTAGSCQSVTEIPEFMIGGQPEIIGLPGRWVTSGRAEFNPGDACCLPTGNHAALWSWAICWSYPTLVLLADQRGFATSFDTTSHRLIGKRITPHTMRYIWATWAYQVQLNDAQFRSLAYAMGHKLRPYARCTSAVLLKRTRRPIEEVSQSCCLSLSQRRSLVWKLDPTGMLLQQVQQLSPVEREQFMAALTKCHFSSPIGVRRRSGSLEMRLFCLKINTTTTSPVVHGASPGNPPRFEQALAFKFFSAIADQADDFQSKKAFGKHLGCQ